MDSPIHLPDGTLRCKAHRLEICGACTVDYTFMREVLEENGNNINENDSEDDVEYEREGDDEWRDFRFEWRRDPLPPLGSFSERLYRPPRPTDKPLELFRAGPPSPIIDDRIIRKTDRSEGLIFTDGACLGNGGPNPIAGWAFVYSLSTSAGVVKGRLEDRGPDNELYQQTSNRAELRAVIAASQFRAWDGEQFSRLIFATDSEYVVRGVTEWIPKWLQNGWRTSKGKPVANRDLWELLLRELDGWDGRGVRLLFWPIPRELNHLADDGAKLAASREANAEFTKLKGVVGLA